MGTTLITPGVGLLFWMTISFLILLFILGKFGWPVIMKMIREREELIQKSLDEAQIARNEMAQLKFSNDQLLKQAMEERDVILKEAHLQSEKMMEETKLRALEESQRIVLSARDSINYEKLQALTELKNQIANFSIEIVEKVLEEELSNKELDKKIIEKRVSDFTLN
ncbi:MAG: synthase, subunit b [Bacteroidetes bacterium]|nr:synthase, subunit b [Bacteroidota bacterium]